ncbi:YihY/virulence factor BrkB family protein [Chitinimonas sp. BJB300]|uniref:YihY/virulence factor BrkB family protein n=1 Tax=Chitinimonas sp. BJB300 TaxID=1559339 RepID=UPI00130459A5|nr:YihY/virulence factor BrkB family protein [Chitinimonas sp. BJB300]
MSSFTAPPSWLYRSMRLFAQAAIAWSDHRAATMGAAIAFYTLFSMGPVLVIAIAIAGSFYGDAAAQAGLLSQVQALLGQQVATAVGSVIQGANQPDRATWQTILAVATSLFAATTVFTELKSSLDIIWDVPKSQQEGVVALIRSRVLSFGIVLSVGFILLVSLLLSTIIAAVESRYGQWFGMSVAVLSLVSNIVTTLVVTMLFAAIFKLLPACPVAWKDVWRGALLTACLYMLGKGLIAMYLGTTALASSYGAAGTLVLILLWMYYSAQVFLYGAVLSREMAKQRAINLAAAEREEVSSAAPEPFTAP